MARLRPSFVITVSALATACGAGEVTPPPLGPIRNPPAPERPTAPEEAKPLSEGSTLNALDGEGRVIYRNGSRCWVDLPFPAPVNPGTAPPQQVVPCPPAMMSEKAWEQCAGATLVVAKAGPPPTCECVMFGNPPPPPATVTCPADVEGRIAAPKQ